MAERIFYFNVTQTDKLDLFLKASLQEKHIEFSRKQLKREILSKKVRINNRVCQYASHDLSMKDRVSILVDLEKQNSKKDLVVSYQLTPSDIIYQDAEIIVINKPPGLPTQGSLDPRRDHLYAATQRYVKENNISDYVGLHHRLDKDTSGLVVFTLKKTANKGIADSFKFRKAKKNYIAICDTPPNYKFKREWQKKNFLKTIREDSFNKSVAADEGDLAITDFSLLKVSKNIAVIQASPKTGRMHQIRTHLSSQALPIIGDGLYGKKTKSLRCLLHAHKLEIQHPITKKHMEFIAPLPADITTFLQKNEIDLCFS